MTSQSEATATDPSLPSVSIDLGQERPAQEDMTSLPTAVALDGVSIYYGSFRAVKEALDHGEQSARSRRSSARPAAASPPCCAAFNRMNDLIRAPGSTGGSCSTGRTSTPRRRSSSVRRRIGMVFQKPNPFPKSIYDNVAFGPRINGFKGKHGRTRRAEPAASRASGTR